MTIFRVHPHTLRFRCCWAQFIWDVETGDCNHTLAGHRDGILVIVYSPRGDQVALGSKDCTFRVWDVGTGECRHIFIGDWSWIASIQYSPRSGHIATSNWGGEVKVRDTDTDTDTDTETCLWTFAVHTEVVRKTVYSTRGDMVISASRDKSVRFWDVRSGQYRAVIEDYESGVDEITLIDACGINYLVAGCWEGSVGMWRVRTDEDNWDVSLSWMLTKGGLDVKDASIQDVQGLSQLNKRLLKQRGAVGEPVHRLREASKAVATMASVVSKLG